MNETRSLLNSLIEVNDCVLAVIDIQDSFLAKLAAAEAELIVKRAVWLVEVARILDMPLVVTAEDIEVMGAVSPALAEKLPPGTPVFNKMVFNLAGQPDILQAVRDTGRKTAVLIGLETDVCVAQSALGLLGNGFRVAVAADACGSPGTGHAQGLERMRGAGVLVTGVKALYYEWIRTVEMSNRIGREHGKRIGIPAGLTL